VLEEAREGSPNGPTEAEDQVPFPITDQTSAVTHAGDVWCLGRHRLICGDARDQAVLDLLMGDERADLLFTDPPYNVPIDGHVIGLGRIRHREFAMGVGEMSAEAFTSFLQQTLGHAAARACNGAIAFVCMDWRHMGELLEAGQAVFSELKNLCVWIEAMPASVKERSSPGSAMPLPFESCHTLISAKLLSFASILPS